jgi:hypothetical protein
LFVRVFVCVGKITHLVEAGRYDLETPIIEVELMGYIHNRKVFLFKIDIQKKI